VFGVYFQRLIVSFDAPSRSKSRMYSRLVEPTLISTPLPLITARHPGEQQHSGGASGSQEVAELKRRNQAMEDALRDALTTGEGAGMFARLPPVG
jgi:hypothetical protein